MTKKINKEDKKFILDDYEKEIEDAVMDDANIDYVSDSEKSNLVEMAKEYKMLDASKRINIRIKMGDLLKIKARASENNIPYQTMLSALIHKFAKDDIKISY